VFDSSGDRGTYRLRLEWLAPLVKQCTTRSLACGAPVSASMETNDQQLWGFDGAAGDVVWVSVASIVEVDSGFSPTVAVYRPDGIVQGYVYDTDGATMTLPLAGRYTLRVYDSGGDRGTYGLPVTLRTVIALPRRVRRDSAAAPLPRLSLPYWHTVKVWLSVAETIEVDNGFSPAIAVYRPDGVVHGTVYDYDSAVVTLPVTGRYTLRVYDSGGERGSYRLRLEWLAPTAKQCTALPVACGTPVNAALDINDQHLRSFDGVAGEVVWLSVAEVVEVDYGFSPLIEVFRPDGVLQSTVYETNGATLVLPLTGRYTLRVNDNGGDRGSYVLRLEWVAPTTRQCTAQAIACGSQVTASLDRNDQDLWGFDAVAGETISASLVETADIDPGFYPAAAVYRPDGVVQGYVYTSSPANMTLPLDGRYTFQVYDNGGHRGSYRLGLGCVIPLRRIIAVTGNLTFGSVTVGRSATRTLTIANSGNDSLTVSGINYPAGFTGAWSGTIPAGAVR